MNTVNLAGRPTDNPVCTSYTYRDNDGNEKQDKRVTFTLAVSVTKGRRYEDATFVRCIAFRNQDEIAMNHISKGQKIIVEGHLKSGRYKDKDGISRYTLDLIVDDVEFCEKKSEKTDETSEEKGSEEFIEVPEISEEGLPMPY